MMKRFKRRSDLIKSAVRNVFKRQAAEDKKFRAQVLEAGGDFLKQCAMKVRMPR